MVSESRTILPPSPSPLLFLCKDESLVELKLGVFLFILYLGEMGARPLPRERVRKQLNLSGLLIAWPVRRAQRGRKEQEVKEIEEGDSKGVISKLYVRLL